MRKLVAENAGRVALSWLQAPDCRVNCFTDTAAGAVIAPPAFRVRPPAGAVIAAFRAMAP